MMATMSCAHHTQTILSIQKVDCASCGAEAVQKLKASPHVKEATYDYVKAELSVSYDPKQATVEELCILASEKGFPVVPGAGKGFYLPLPSFPEGLDVAWLAKEGQAINLEDHLVPAKITLIDFYAPWCGPCRVLDKHLAKMLAENEDLALRKVNMVDWNSPAADKYSEHMTTLPHVFVYDANGKRVASISGLELEALKTAIEKARAQQ